MTKKPHPGRPTVAASPGTRSTVSLRLTAPTKDKLDAASKAKGRPFSHEAEFRLENSFEKEGLLTEVLKLSFSSEVAGLLIALGTLMENAGRTTAAEIAARSEQPAGDWASEPHALHQALETAINFLSRAQSPVGKTSKHIREEVSEGRPQLLAGELARAVKGTASTEWPQAVFGKERISEIRTLLGRLSAELKTDGPAMKNVSAKG